ncbi:MAG: aldo/keto reductase, partial [Clostridia bacterium]|nr:aldo/keto reductase [Clostridia bacterium]
YLIKQKQNGRIKHLGFSTHASIENMKRFLEKYGKDMEFCQIQLNYLDYKLQYAKEKVELLDSYNIPVWVMEPLRGGRLNRLSEKEAELLSKIRPEESNVAKAFRFVQSIPQVTMTLSGMGTMEQLEENMATFSENKPYSEEEMKELMAVSDEMLSSKMLPCTVCRYCENHCPMELPISDMVAMYNEYSFSEGGMLTPMRMATVPENKRPANCVGCKSCEQVCPQNIKISEMMADFAEKVKEMKL